MIHELKTWPEYFEKILTGEKTFEFRLQDRDFKVGDTLRLRERIPNFGIDDSDIYTGRDILKTITYILPDIKTKMGYTYCILALSRES